MRIVLCLALLLALCLSGSGTALAADTLTNIRRPAAPQATPRALVPGAVVRLPDGRQTRILEVRPDGIITDLGVTLTPEGTVPGAAETAPVTVVEEAVAPATPETAVITPETPLPETPQTTPGAPKEETAQAPGTPEIAVPEAQTPSAPEQAAPAAPVSPEAAPHQLTIVELLPMTPAKEEAKKAPAPKAEEKKAEAAKEEKAEKPKTEKPKAEKPKESPKPRESKKKPAIGEELSIPPEAVATGKLDFLEGCWQGTRPEYYSKRMIKECFCFDVNGGAGKRRVIDSLGGRMCIGSSRAKLSKEGVLSVTSSGAACTDGERWGQAEMVCKGTGQRAPCTWVFKDAQGGRQSYEIPFVRVESCGR
ncbi:MAG: hypothetical protein HDQ94_00510 [Desulfovibrio sp.]|nr:hypothetical protein [Desulfovibrio sp.]